MKYISINEMNDIVRKNLNKIPNDIDLVVANPRSGLLPETIISLIKNLPICDIDSFAQNRIYSHGSTKENNFINDINDARQILIVEDSSYSGNSINLIKNKSPQQIKNRCLLLVIFTNQATKSMCDIYFEVVDESRIFEWNLFHHRYLNYAGIDLNVIYENNILKINPTQKIEAIIINNSLNKNKIENELIKYNVKFNRIIYSYEIDEKIKFIIISNIKKFKNYHIDIIDYDNGLFYKKM